MNGLGRPLGILQGFNRIGFVPTMFDYGFFELHHVDVNYWQNIED